MLEQAIYYLHNLHASAAAQTASAFRAPTELPRVRVRIKDVVQRTVFL